MKNGTRAAVLVLAAALGMPNNAVALNACPTTAGTAATIASLGATGCEVGTSVMFQNWTLDSANSLGATVLPTASNIMAYSTQTGASFNVILVPDVAVT